MSNVDLSVIPLPSPLNTLPIIKNSLSVFCIYRFISLNDSDPLSILVPIIPLVRDM